MNDKNNMSEKPSSVVFVSNFFNHHQKPFSDAMYRILGENYCFIETSEVSKDRKQMGLSKFVIPSYGVSFQEHEKDPARYQEIIDQADVVICRMH